MTLRRIFQIGSLLIVCAKYPSASTLAQDAPSLPGGASSLQESYQDWQVACRIADATKRCAVSQQQAQQNGRRVLAIELQVGADNAITGNLILPFGLLLESGVTLQIDEQETMAPFAFRTCLPAGCVVPLGLDQASVDALRNGSVLKLIAKSSDAAQDVAFAISLKGFSASVDRIKTLTGG